MMTEHKLFNTKILLRNDDLSNWIESPLVLGKGEVALSWEDGNCKLKVGNGSSAWSGLDYLALDESQISSFLTELEGNVGDLTTRLGAAESEIDALSSNAKTYQLSADGQTVYLMEKSGEGDFNPTAVSFTIPTVPSTDPYGEGNPLATQKYVDDAISAVEETVADGLDAIRSELSSAWHVKGVLTPPDDSFPGKDFDYIPPLLYKSDEEPQDGDIVINKNIEYVWANGKWNELGNEGNYAVKGAIVDADIANNAEIDQTKIASSQGNDNLAEDIEKLVFNAYSFEVGATEISSLEDIIDANESTLSNANKGDIIVINSKNVSADFGRQSFVFAGTDPLSAPCWETLNEKYTADNVYLQEDLQLAGNYTLGNVKTSTTGSYVVSKGTSVAEMMSEIFTKEDKNAATAQPQFTFSASGSAGSKEVGETYTVPGATFKYTNVGSYKFGPDTGVTVDANMVTIQRTTDGEEDSTTNTEAIALSATFSLGNGSTGLTFLDYANRKTYSYVCSASHSEGTIPVSNIGTQLPDQRIVAGTTWAKPDDAKTDGTAAASATFYGYRNYYMISLETAVDVKTLNSATIRSWATNTTHGSSGKAYTNAALYPSTFTAKKDAIQVIIAVPATNAKTVSAINESSMNAPFALNKSDTMIQVSGAVAGENMTNYIIWSNTLDGPLAGDAKLKLTWA